jgi:non-ribosomal peptide synthetase component E (peptide arylation enzyme)
MSAETFNACAPEAATLVLTGEPDAPGGTGPDNGLPAGVSVPAWADILAEGRLLEHPSVAECAMVGHRNTAGLEEVVACVVPAPGRSVDADGLIAFCREGLASFKRPRQVLALDALPKTATGKIQRVVVRDVVAQRPGKPGE